MKKWFASALVALVVGVGTFVTIKVMAQAPSPYTPPHPYPTPNDPTFPKPGDVVRYYTGGFTVDEINDQVKFFRSDTFWNDMARVMAMAGSSTCGTNVSGQFSTIKAEALNKIANEAAQLTQKKNQIVNEGSLNDGSTAGANANTPFDTTTVGGSSQSPTDEQLKQDVLAFYNREYCGLVGGTAAQTDASVNCSSGTSYYARAMAASDCNTLKTVSGDAQAYVHSQEFTTQLKTLAVRVFAERLNYWNTYLQSIMDYNIGCVAPYLNQAMGERNPALANAYPGDYATFVYDTNAPLYTDWYNLTTFTDARRAFTHFFYQYMDSAPGQPVSGAYYDSVGAREEYRLAATVAKSNACVGAPTAVCRDGIHMHMRAAKYLLQDIFHISWWEYDNLLLYNEQNPTAQMTITSVVQACPNVPEQRGLTNSQTQPSGFPAWPTVQPRTRAR